ncbi:MAG: hypothetical protein R2787_06915 [Saprospiraceae bacterium]
MNEKSDTFDRSIDPGILVSFPEKLSDEPLVEYEGELAPSDLVRESKGRHVQTFSARVLDWDENFVKTEWVINLEEGKYQIRFFPIEMFKNTKFLKHGYKLKAFLFIKSKEMQITFEDGSKLVMDDEFPKPESLTQLKSKLFNFK